MRKQLMAALAIVGLVLVLTSCSDDKNPVDGGNGGAEEDPTFAADVLPILTANCGVPGCHSGEFPTQGLDLTAARAHSAIVGVMSTEAPSLELVKAGDAANSFLVHKISGTQSVGGRMPFGRTPLSSTQINTIRDWIDAGALDN